MNRTPATCTVGSRLFVSGVLAVLLIGCPTNANPPVVTLSGLTSVTSESTLVMTATATPGKGSGFNGTGSDIAKVELYEGSKKLMEKTAGPYAFEIKLASGDNGKKLFKAKAYDAAGTVGESNVVTVDVNIAVPDTTPPTVASVDPPNGATGVRKDKVITVTFSKPMNQIATQAAYQSADLPSSAVTFTWSADGKIMTIKPNALLQYKETADPNDQAKTYSLIITNTATDVVGNKLNQTGLNFSTLKQVKSSNLIRALQFSLDSSGTDILDCYVVCVGDSSKNNEFRGFFVFNLTQGPADLNSSSLISARLSYELSKDLIHGAAPSGLRECSPLTYPCTSLLVESVTFKISEPPVFNSQASPLCTYTLFDYMIHPLDLVDPSGYKYTLVSNCTTNPPNLEYGVNSMDLTQSLTEAFKSKVLGIRFRFPKSSNFDSKPDYIVLEKPSLEITYLAP